jgi:hypothetical protein
VNVYALCALPLKCQFITEKILPAGQHTHGENQAGSAILQVGC